MKSRRYETRLRIMLNKQRRRDRHIALSLAREVERRAEARGVLAPFLHDGFYARDGWPMSTREYFAKRMDSRYQRVDRTCGDGWRVSTIWIGAMLGRRDDVPLIFESLVSGGPLDATTLRYTSESSARAGHALLVRESSVGRGNHSTLDRP